MIKLIFDLNTELNSYALVAFLQDYVNSEGIRNPITIRSRTARKWLNRLGYKYRYIGKNVFVDGHERLDVVKDRENFLETMKNLTPYLVEFDENGNILPKTYPADCGVGGDQRRPVILITHDECVFSANDGPRSGWQKDGDTFLRPKSKGRGIMVSEFLLPFKRLNFSHLTLPSQTELMETYGLTTTEAVEIFEFGKNNDGYWTGADLLKQVKEKALPIARALYPGYSLCFLFDNATSHSVFAPDALDVKGMGKGSGGKQSFLRDGWFYQDGIKTPQAMSFQLPNGTQCQKGIRRVLEERGLWPAQGLNLECPKSVCPNCEARSHCTSCVKGTRCDTCKTPKAHTGTIPCTTNRKCDGCMERERQCTCISKKYCERCTSQKGKCGDCEELPPKCTSDCKLIFHH